MTERAVLDITVSPKSSKSKITIDSDNNIKVYLNSPPVDGKANSECIQLFSKKLHIAKSNITIEKGIKGKKKKLLIDGLSYDEIIKILNG